MHSMSECYAALDVGIHAEAVRLVENLLFAVGGKIFIYQSAVLVVGYSYGYFDARDMLRVGAYLTIAQLIILVVLVPLYWPLIGLT